MQTRHANAAPTIVGYGNVSTAVKGGNKIIGASFKNLVEVNGVKGIWLSSLKVVGYDNDFFKARGGVKGDFTITILNANGGTALDDDGCEKYYTYWDKYANGKWSGNPTWYNEELSEDCVDEYDVFLPVGEGLWFFITPSAFTQGESYSLQSAGEAIIDAQSIPFRPGNKAICVPLSTSVKLSQVSVTGYKTDFFKARGGVKGDFTITILNPNGGTAMDPVYDAEMYYTYWDKYVNERWSTAPAWFNEELSEDVIDDYDVTLPMGEGMWCFITPSAFTEDPDKEGEYLEHYSLVFPGIDEE